MYEVKVGWGEWNGSNIIWALHVKRENSYLEEEEHIINDEDQYQYG